MARGMVNQALLLKKETVPGTADITNMRRYLGIKGMPGWDVTTEYFKASGYKVDTGENTLTELGRLELEVIQDYNALLPLMSGVFGPPITSSLGTNAFRHVFRIEPKAADALATFTAMWGDSTLALQMTYLIFHGLTFRVQRNELALSSSASVRAPATGISMPAGVNEVQTVTITGSPTGGTYTLTFGGATTSTIPWNATSAQVRTALESLSTIGAGNVATAGGPHPGTAITVTFQNALGGKNVALMTANSAGLTPSGTVTPTETTPGSGPEEIAMVPVRAQSWDVYLDSTWATAGTTKLLALYSYEASYGDKYTPDWVVNSALPSFSEQVENDDIEYGLNAVVGYDSTAVTQIADALSGGMKFIRAAVTGPVITGGTDNYSLAMTNAVRFKPGNIVSGPNAPTVAVELNGRMQVDSTSGQFAYATLVNSVPTL